MLENLNTDKIRTVLSQQNLARLTALDIFDVINSTNTYLLERAKSECKPGWACFAELQTKGRGRQGKTWYSPKGANIYFSYLCLFAINQAQLAGLSIAVGVMVAKALQRYGITNLQLKWPNDVLYQGRKLAGILLESLPPQASVIPMVVGVGLNVALVKDESLPEIDNWIDVASLCQDKVDRNYLAGLLLDEILSGIFLFQQQGLAPFLSYWKQSDYLLAKNIQVILGWDTVYGVCQGIGESGELLLKTDKGLIPFQSGEVSVRLNNKF
jgi:BirA family transcriptional regulator, biotin operon repressor / biotin---[acetyl-CoA-carboxylase] ligase